MSMSSMPPSERKAKEDIERAPTVLAILGKSTPAERAAVDVDGEPTEDARAKADELAADLYRTMMEWAAHWEPRYLAADERWDFYDGRHWGYKSVPLGIRIIDPPASASIKRVTYNYIRLDTERQVSIILKDPPVIKAYAGASEIMDQAASGAGNVVVDWRQQRTLLSADTEHVARNSAVAGWCWVHDEFDTSIGKLVPQLEDDGKTPRMKPVIDPSGQMMTDPTTGEPVKEPDLQPEGDFVRELISHRQGVPDPSAKHIFGGSGFFVRKKLSRFDFARMFPHLKIEEFPPDGDERLKKTTALMSGPMRSAGGGPTNKDELDIGIFYAPKCVGYEKGVRIIFTETRLVEEMDNPKYPTDSELERGESEPNQSLEPCWPVFPFVFGLSEGDPLGFSPIADAISLNKAINGLGTSAVMHAALAKGKWKVPNDLAQELTDETLQIIKVSPRRFDPNTLGALVPPPMPEAYIPLWREHVETLHSVMWLNQPAVGSQESAGDSGYKVRLQQQVADNNLEKVRERQNDMWACLYQYELFMFRRHVNAKRAILIVGENRAAYLRELDKTAIMPGTNVRCVHNSFMPRDPSMKMAWFQQFMGTGVMQLPAVQQQQMFEWIGAQNTDIFIDTKRADVMRAKRQILAIMNGQDPGQISDMDDHVVQMDVIRTFGLSEEFETKVKQELAAAQQQAASMPPAGVDAMGQMVQAAPPMSPTFTRVTGLYQAHKDAMVAQTQAAAPPPQAAPGGAVEAMPPKEPAVPAPSGPQG